MSTSASGSENLQLHQAAYLAGLIRSPERADAAREPDEASRRRDTVLAGMVAEEYITAEEAEAAGAVPWVWEPVGPDGTPQTMTVLPRTSQVSDLGEVRDAEYGAEYWVDLARRQLRDRFGPGAETQGLRVYTTYDPVLQQAALRVGHRQPGLGHRRRRGRPGRIAGGGRQRRAGPGDGRRHRLREQQGESGPRP